MEDSTADRPQRGETGPINEEKKILVTAAIVLVADQLAKQLVVRALEGEEKKILIDGFLRVVNWQNTGAAWSMFQDSSILLAALSALALVMLIRYRHHFETHSHTGKVALGLLIGGIVGNLIDRLIATLKQTSQGILEMQIQGSSWASGTTGKLLDTIKNISQYIVETTSMGDGVVDFVRFYIIRSDGSELGCPAFNIADMGICTGVGLLFLLAWREGVSEGETEKDS